MGASSRAARTRQAQLAKIHLLAKKSGLIEGDDKQAYRQMLLEQTGLSSAGAMSTAQRAKVLRHLSPADSLPQSTPRARLIRHIWRAMADAGHVADDGLSGWLRRQTRSSGVTYEQPEFLPAATGAQVIESLKRWAERLNVDWR